MLFAAVACWFHFHHGLRAKLRLYLSYHVIFSACYYGFLLIGHLHQRSIFDEVIEVSSAFLLKHDSKMNYTFRLDTAGITEITN